MRVFSGTGHILTAGFLVAAACLPAAAQQSGDAPRPFRVGLVAPERGAPAVEGLAAIKAALAGAAGGPVEVVVARDYSVLVQAQLDGRVDYAVYSATAYAAAALRCGCVRAVVAPVDRNGAIGIRSALIRRPAGGGAIAVGPPDSLAGRLAPMAGWPGAERGGLLEAGSLTAAEALFLDGEAGGFFGWTLAWSEDTGAPMGGTVARLREAGLGADDFHVDWVSPPLRYGPHAVRDDADPATVERLVTFMTGMDSNDDGIPPVFTSRHDGGLVAVSHEDYAPVIDAVAALNAARRDGVPAQQSAQGISELMRGRR